MTVVAIDSALRAWFEQITSPMFILEGTELIEANPFARDHWPEFDEQRSIKELIIGIKLTGDIDQLVEDPTGQQWHAELLQVPASRYFVCQLRRKQDISEQQLLANRLRELHQVSVTLLNCRQSVDFFYQVVESGLQRLGFDRMAVFLTQENGQVFRGTWGTDDDGEISNEMEFRAPMPDSPWVIEALNMGNKITVWDNFPLRYYGREIGRGWNAMVPLTDGKTIYGWISVDNLIRRLPITKSHRQLLTDFGDLVTANLISRPELLDLS